MTLSMGIVLGPLAVLPRLVPAGHGVAAPEPAVEAGYHLLPALVEDEEGVAVRGCDGGVDAVEEAVEADPLAALHVGLAEADVDDLHAADGPCGVLDDAQAAGENFGPVVTGQLAPSGQQVAGMKLAVGGDGVAFLQLEPPVVDAAGQVVPPLGVHAQGGADVVSASTPRAERT